MTSENPTEFVGIVVSGCNHLAVNQKFSFHGHNTNNTLLQIIQPDTTKQFGNRTECQYEVGECSAWFDLLLLPRKCKCLLSF